MTPLSPLPEVLSILGRDTNVGHISLQVLAKLPSVEKMAAAKDLQKCLNKSHRHAYRLVSYTMPASVGFPASSWFTSSPTFAEGLL